MSAFTWPDRLQFRSLNQVPTALRRTASGSITSSHFMICPSDASKSELDRFDGRLFLRRGYARVHDDHVLKLDQKISALSIARRSCKFENCLRKPPLLKTRFLYARCCFI